MKIISNNYKKLSLFGNARKSKEKLKKYRPYSIIFGSAILISFVCSELAFAASASSAADAALNIEGAITTSTAPVIAAVKKYWTSFLMLPAAGSAFIGEGDLRQRAVRAAIGTTVAGMVMMGIIAFLGQ